MTIAATLLHYLSFSQFGFNLLDLVIVLVICFYAYEGYILGLIAALIDLTSFIFSFILALKFYGPVGMFLVHLFSIPVGFAHAGGFFLMALFAEVAINIFLRSVLKLIPPLRFPPQVVEVFHKTDHFLGIIPGMISSFIILSFLLSVIISLPSSPFLKTVVSTSRFGSLLVANTALFENRLNDIFGGALHETLNFMTIEPHSDERVDLHFKVANGQEDADAAKQMLAMVNKERQKAGLDALTLDTALSDLALAYSNDMFQRGYFSHYNPEGLSPFDRMEKAGITYSYAGENLALAPSTDLAMQGLMNSPGHRANILSPNFKKIGIGVIDGGIYGKMFTQEFTD